MIAVVAALARRALVNTLRRPQFAAPLLVFPTLFLAANVGGLTHTTDLPGFPPVENFLDFQLPGAMTQALLIGGLSSGIAVALEIESGFFDRLVVSPIPRTTIVLGRLAAGGALATVQIIYFLAIGLIFGAAIHGGFVGVVAIFAIGIIAGIGFSAIGVLIALLARNASTVQGVFPLTFVILFASSAYFPADLLQDPVKAIAVYNPLSYIASGIRDPITSSTSLEPVLEGLGAALGLAAVMISLSVVALRHRLRRA